MKLSEKTTRGIKKWSLIALISYSAVCGILYFALIIDSNLTSLLSICRLLTSIIPYLLIGKVLICRLLDELTEPYCEDDIGPVTWSNKTVLLKVITIASVVCFAYFGFRFFAYGDCLACVIMLISYILLKLSLCSNKLFGMPLKELVRNCSRVYRIDDCLSIISSLLSLVDINKRSKNASDHYMQDQLPGELFDESAVDFAARMVTREKRNSRPDNPNKLGIANAEHKLRVETAKAVGTRKDIEKYSKLSSELAWVIANNGDKDLIAHAEAQVNTEFAKILAKNSKR